MADLETAPAPATAAAPAAGLQASLPELPVSPAHAQEGASESSGAAGASAAPAPAGQSKNYLKAKFDRSFRATALGTSGLARTGVTAVARKTLKAVTGIG